MKSLVTGSRAGRFRIRFRCWLACCGLFLLPWSSLALAQDLELPLGGFGSPGAIPAGDPVTLSAKFKVYTDGKGGQVEVTAEIAPGWHVYSITQTGGSALPTTIKLGKTDQIKLTSSFVPDHPPELKSEGVGDMQALVEIHEEKVTWTASFEFIESVADPEQITIPLVVDGQACLESCMLYGGKIEAKFAGTATRPAAGDSGYAPQGAHGKFEGKLSGKVEGDEVVLTWELKAIPVPKWHVYALGIKEAGQVSTPTQIHFQLPKGWKATQPQASSKPLKKETGLKNDPTMFYHEQPVTWTVKIRGPRKAVAADTLIKAWVGYQFCSDRACDLPEVMTVTAGIGELAEESSVTAPLAFQAATMPYDELTKLMEQTSFELAAVEVDDELMKQPLAWILLFAVLGGFLLNFMPCVLPVIGLKIMAFVEQAGASRAKVFLLNFWYGVGMLIVFLILATLISAKDLGWRESEFGWGQQSQSPAYVIAMSSVIFVMALSFLGVWEIPVPGFVGTSKMAQYSERNEGYSAALFKGVITTLVAIPCTAPALSTALAWCANKPPPIVFTVFVAMWFGMAVPYFVIGLFPKLVSFIPKPGLWMETFKEFLGFLLLGTVVFFLHFLDWPLVMPTVAFLVALWMACWILGKIPWTAPTGRKMLLRLLAAGVALAGGWFSYGYFDDVMASRFQRDAYAVLAEDGAGPAGLTQTAHSEHELPWQRFSLKKLEDELAKGNTVLIDFTADW